MRFLIVLALIKCAATQHGVFLLPHKTVSVPIGNGMNVDINVTVGVNTGGNEQCVLEGEECSIQEDCCYGLFCPLPSYPPVEKQRCKKDVGCLDRGEDCGASGSHYCCDPLLCNILTGKCDDAKKGPAPCKKKGPCGSGYLQCCKGYYCSRRGRHGAHCEKKHKTDENCTPAGQPCETSSECCEYETQTMTCQESGYKKRCMPSKDQKCNANEGEYCTKDEDCCEKDNACKYENGRDRPTCTYKPKDCIEDGEPCHGTNDWTHECCSKSCCEGKCGTCGYTPWFKRF